MDLLAAKDLLGPHSSLGRLEYRTGSLATSKCYSQFDPEKPSD